MAQFRSKRTHSEANQRKGRVPEPCWSKRRCVRFCVSPSVWLAGGGGGGGSWEITPRSRTIRSPPPKAVLGNHSIMVPSCHCRRVSWKHVTSHSKGLTCYRLQHWWTLWGHGWFHVQSSRGHESKRAHLTPSH